MTTLATLLLELSLTRIFSVVFYYHFAFLAISIALFGLGVGGVLSYLVAGRSTDLFGRLGTVSLLNAGLVLAALLFLLTRGADVGPLDLAVIYFMTALPFLGAGIVVSLAISTAIERVDRIYFFDLLGAAGGCLVLVLLLNTIGGPSTAIAVAVLFASAAAVWFSLSGARFGRIGRILSVFAGLLLTVVVIANKHYNFLEIRYAKGQKLHTEQFTKWNSISRIGMARDEHGGGMIYIDADASTGIADFDFNHLSAGDLENLLHQGPAIPYNLRPGAKTLVIGPGGGWDVSRALASGSHDVTAVEINPIIANDIMRKRPELSNGLYLRPDVHLHIEDGRSFVRRSPEKYQVIQATLVDTWASTAAGAFALSENNLYTTEAFRDYLSHLTDDGLLTFTRWGFDPPRESLRLVSLAIEALNALGEHDPARHVLAGRAGHGADLNGWGAQDTVMISRKPLSDADVARAREAFRAAHMDTMYAPGDGPVNPFGQLLLAADPAAYERSYQFDITPVSDNRPFFFYTVQPRDVAAYLLQSSRAADAKVNVALPKLFSALIVSVIAVLIILLLPPAVLGTRLPRERSVQSFLLYFLAIGAGYILIEVALIQKFVLFLGHPTYALTVVIFSMLISSGLGSFLSRKVVGDRNDRLIAALAVAAALVALVTATVQTVVVAGVGLPLAVKAMETVLLIAPLGFAMGLPFPTGLRLLEARHAPAVRWAWSLNAAASVLGSVGALVLALYLGLAQTMLIGGGLYLCAMAVVAVNPMARKSVKPLVSAEVSASAR